MDFGNFKQTTLTQLGFADRYPTEWDFLTDIAYPTFSLSAAFVYYNIMSFYPTMTALVNFARHIKRNQNLKTVLDSGEEVVFRFDDNMKMIDQIILTADFS